MYIKFSAAAREIKTLELCREVEHYVYFETDAPPDNDFYSVPIPLCTLTN